MSAIDSNNSLNTILNKLGIQKPVEEKGASDKLGQADFFEINDNPACKTKILLRQWRMQNLLHKWLNSPLLQALLKSMSH